MYMYYCYHQFPVSDFMTCFHLGISELRDALYYTACNMKELGNKTLGTRYLLGRSIPNSYLLIEKEIYRELENRIRDGKPPFLVQRELYELIENIPSCDVEVPQEVPEGNQ